VGNEEIRKIRMRWRKERREGEKKVRGSRKEKGGVW
jgi:hypothetical protein